MGEDLIGRRYLDRIVDSKGNGVVIYEASMSSYVLNAERMATPIYPHDAGTIVSMLELHPERPDEGEGEGEELDGPFEVFEAGTGMGSLTLHIARALHAGNRGMSRDMREAVASAGVKRLNGSVWSVPEGVDESVTDPAERRTLGGVESLTLARLEVSDTLAARLRGWQDSRRYVLHSLDRNVAHAREAWRFLRGFRAGMYLPNVDVHIGSVDAYLGGRLARRGDRPFLSRAVLDMPSPQDFAAPVVRALRTNGLLVVFNPSISQIAEFARWTAEDEVGKRLKLEKVVELANTVSVSAAEDGGLNDGGGGRAWDVRTVVPRSREGDGERGAVAQVMRPKVGDRVGGGGFVAVFRKWPVREEGGSVVEEGSLGEETEQDEVVTEAEEVSIEGEPTKREDTREEGTK